MAEDEVQYHIEIQDGQCFDESAEVMVVLDLNGQDLPESVAQTIIELAQNSRQGQIRVGEHMPQLMVEERQDLGEGGEFIEYITTEDGDILHEATGETHTVTTLGTEVKLEDMNIFSAHESDGRLVKEQHIIPPKVVVKNIPKFEEIKPNNTHTITNIQTSTGPRILVKNLAELEHIKAGNYQAITHMPENTRTVSILNTKFDVEPKQETSVDIASSSLEEGLRVSDTKVEMGVQCEIINPLEEETKPQITPQQKAKAGNNASFFEKLEKLCVIQKPNLHVEAEGMDTGDSGEGYAATIKNEPSWEGDPDNEVAAASESAEPEETASVPPQPAPMKSCPKCDFTCHEDLDLGRHLKQVHNEKKPFVCSVCNASFEMELSFQIHVVIHADRPTPKKKTPLKCPECREPFLAKRELTLHLKDVHNMDQVFVCEKCKLTFASKSALLAHKKSASHEVRRNKVSICPVCNVACMKMQIHLSKQHPDYRPFACEKCSYTAKNKYALENHMFSHRESKDFICPKCDRACKSKISLKKHIKIHDPNKKFRCALCEFATNDSYEYRRHGRRVHTRKSYYSCKYCNLSFVNHCDLKLHAMSEHNSRDSFYCKYENCDFSCQTKIEFKRHVQIHTGKHKYLCDICDFTTAWKTHLERHLDTHSGIRPLKCPECDYACREQINLKKHMVIHSDAKPWMCSECPYTCKLKNLLDSHIRIMHSGLKPYACTQCTYASKTASNLKKHMWIHDQYRPHQCRFCNYQCREGNKLRRHERKKHKDLLMQDQVDQTVELEEAEVEVTKEAFKQEIIEGYNIVFATPSI